MQLSYARVTVSDHDAAVNRTWTLALPEKQYGTWQKY